MFLMGRGITYDLIIVGASMAIVCGLSARVLKRRWNVSYLHIISLLAVGMILQNKI